MEYQNFLKTLEGFTQRAPFRPFSVELVTGRHFEVTHPEALVIRGGTAIYATQGHDLVIFDHDGVVSFTGPTTEKTPATGNGNGSSQP